MSLRAQAIAEGYQYVALRGSRVVGFASTKKEAEKLGKPERLPSIPAKYLRGFTGKARVKRVQEILRERRKGTYKPLPSDKGVKTKRSSWSVKFQRKYNERPDNVADVARLTGIRKSILQKVYNKGLAAWSTGGHRPGASQHAWAMARVQSFVLGGPTAKGPDKKLAQQAGLVRNPLFPDPPPETTGAKKHRAGTYHAQTIKLWMGAPSINSLYYGVHVSPNLSSASAYALGRLRVEEFPAEVLDAPVLIGIGKTCVAEDLGDMDMLTTARNLWEQSAYVAQDLVEDGIEVDEIDWEEFEIADYAADQYFSELDYLGFRQVLGTLATRPEQADYADALTKMALYRIRHKLLAVDQTDMDDLKFPTSPKKQAEIKLRKYAISLAEKVVPQVRLPCMVKWEDVVYVGVLPPIAPGTSEKPLRDGSGYQESFPYDKSYQEDLEDVDRADLDRMMDKALVDVYGDRSKVKYWHGTSSTFAASAFPKHLNKAVLDEASFEPEVWEDDLEENPAETLDQFFSRISSLNLSLCLVRFPKGNIDDMKFTGPVPNSKLEEQERVQVCLFEGKFDPSRLDMLKSPRYSKPYGELVGYVSLKKPPYPCNGALIVGSSALASKYQRQGLGTFMYMCAMYAFGPIISDRQSVSDKALAMYSRLDRRFAQFDAVMLDDVYEPETPPTDDDCWIYEGWSDDDEAVMTLNKSYRMRPHVKKQMKPVFDRMVKRFHSRVLNPIQKLPNWRLVMPEVLVNYWRQSSDLFNEEYE